MGSASENATQEQIIQREVDLIRPDGSEQDKDEDKDGEEEEEEERC